MQTPLALIVVFTVVALFVRKQLRKHNYNGCGCVKCNCKDDQ